MASEPSHDSSCSDDFVLNSVGDLSPTAQAEILDWLQIHMTPRNVFNAAIGSTPRIELASLVLNDSQTLTSGMTAKIAWNEFWASDVNATRVFATGVQADGSDAGHNTTADTYLTIMQPGVVIVNYNLQWPSVGNAQHGAYVQQTDIVGPAGGISPLIYGGNQYTTNTEGGAGTSAGTYVGYNDNTFDTSIGLYGAQLYMDALQLSGISTTVTNGAMRVVWISRPDVGVFSQASSQIF